MKKKMQLNHYYNRDKSNQHTKDKLQENNIKNLVKNYLHGNSNILKQEMNKKEITVDLIQ